jgi:hypothetical protein
MGFIDGQNVQLINNKNVPDIPSGTEGKVIKNLSNLSSISLEEFKSILDSLEVHVEGASIVDFTTSIKVIPNINLIKA